MTDQISIQLPEALYRRVEQLSRRFNQPVEEVLADALTLAEKQAVFDEEDRQMAREQAAYEAMHRELMAEFEGQYVAVHNGQLVDHDADELALLKRVDEKFPQDIVLLKEVRPLPERVLRFRSPRLIRK